MQHSLELRVPLVDHKLVEFCARIPSSLKIRRTEKKYLLRLAARNHVPSSVLNHRKQGFASPMAAWLRSDLRPMIDEFLCPSEIRAGGLFSESFVNEAVSDHLSRKQLNDKMLFSLLAFQVWWKSFAQDGKR